MGSSQSTLVSPETALTAVVLAGAIGLGVTHFAKSASQPAPESPPASKKGKKKNQKGKDNPEAPASVAEMPPAMPAGPAIVPGQFDPSIPLATKKPKKKKTKSKSQPKPDSNATPSQTDVHSESSLDDEPVPKPAPKPKRQQKKQPVSHPLQQSTMSIDTDGSWTRVESRRRASGPSQSDTGPHDLSTTSDAGIASSVTGGSSPVDEGNPSVIPFQPLPGEKPAAGFSWGDYENVRISDDAGNGDNEDDDGWGVVKSRGRPKSSRAAGSNTTQKDPEGTVSKRKRQNDAKREAEKAARRQDEADRLAALAKHRQELEKERRKEDLLQKAYSSGKKSAAGGDKSYVDERGKLVWDYD